ncbi:hypothetical protein [Desulfosporosinus meridiei]|uniref:Uncharacterized protein n=1 Tax=Desulfosporosinus meridiei (strain ATCC BAA-275 / DSM 13257 / KCTC 12902 / NCIMB 13706 / S10) TaxID=768704 RepID=J7IU73_DESMD|nr:hypothetical protein [Desulfosporosinus meridiei]AFQ42236.1 hypothetical protein Desmer_0169 [Desulfosporosinus meridiei DSM 13257]
MGEGSGEKASCLLRRQSNSEREVRPEFSGDTRNQVFLHMYK